MSHATPSGLTEIPYQAIIEQSLAGIYVLQDERFCYANATFAGMLGYAPEEMMGQHLSDMVRPGFLDTVLDRYHRRLAGNPPSMRFVTEGLHRDGRTILIEVHGTQTLYRNRPAVVGIGIEATQRIRNEEELQRSRQRLQDLSAYTAWKLEEQRQQFARNLHDELGGMLTAIKMDTIRILRRIDDEPTRAMASDLAALTQRTINAVKRLSEEVRPSALDRLDLSFAFERDLQDFTRRSGVPHALDARPLTEPGLSPRRATAIYRVFQEALTNIGRHAAARHVQVRLQMDGDHVRLDVIDDGCGFDPEGQGKAGLGLLSMAERTREIGGELRIDSAPADGTRVSMRTPLLQGLMA